jgi:hypothetical protein
MHDEPVHFVILDKRAQRLIQNPLSNTDRWQAGKWVLAYARTTIGFAAIRRST